MNTNEPITDAVVRLSGNNGNAFAILANVKKAIRNSDRPDVAEDFFKEATSSDYDHLLEVCSKYVTVE